MLNSTDDRILEKLDDIARWLKLAYGATIRKQLEETLDSDGKRRAYEATDGSASTRDIGQLVGVDQKTIVRWWAEWAEVGLIEPGPDRKDRPRKLISLTYFKMLLNSTSKGEKLVTAQTEESKEDIMSEEPSD
jgi:hypothetical protein